MQTTIRPQERQAAKRQIIEDIEQGASVQEARARFVPGCCMRICHRVGMRIWMGESDCGGKTAGRRLPRLLLQPRPSSFRSSLLLPASMQLKTRAVGSGDRASGTASLQ
jgi:hypothetical protein